MHAFSFGDVLRRVTVWWRSLPRWYWIVGGAILVVLSTWMRELGLTGLHEFCLQVLHDLGLIQPFSMMGFFFNRIAACHSLFNIAGEDTGIVNCNWWHFVLPNYLVGSLLGVLGDVWVNSGVPGKIILPLALVASFPIAVSIVAALIDKIFGETGVNPVTLGLAAMVTPLIAGIFALVLQLIGMAVFYIFGEVLALLMMVGTLLTGLLEMWKLSRESEHNAHRLERVVETASVVLGVAKKTEDEFDPKSG